MKSQESFDPSCFTDPKNHEKGAENMTGGGAESMTGLATGGHKQVRLLRLSGGKKSFFPNRLPFSG
jgi:hypothetical protein